MAPLQGWDQCVFLFLVLDRLIVGWLRRLSAVFKNTLEIITGVGVAKAMQCIERQNKTLLLLAKSRNHKHGSAGTTCSFSCQVYTQQVCKDCSAAVFTLFGTSYEAAIAIKLK